ncbi:MAG: class I SAM-dependent RNA methyltransferase [Limosilactobacillus oris]|mgnify:FL=1|uniref:THUMP domain-containing class I SAM-dependent RNA methyltransferase n=1 Tax=Limosilactobacillus oris TaxID=1632 RepID=UPI000789DAD7|nr:class I SAM-dependent RNA methyltransferase [Limosilactobacillus oris]AMS07738.1 RNA methyltransferase [Limosilactobacillus oris]MCH3911596.1 class I SAM-dependent RNA methyltransferase [Limosilactobacillus oris]MCH3938846.1 class I SAM-dependent RNA methyltransferase [Limosilactobacillus oris]MCI1981261.1 class I SAM-dependent RNA methyltransferase [Limosilactobacillus oris]MCI2043369.1 class I SAM-dependent RNA methyltransferase [Limosilactobacillus oris]
MQKYQLMATAAAGIEALVGKELRRLGYDTQVENGRVRYQGDMRDILTTNLWLRTADRVKIIVGEFTARTFDELFEQTKALPWESFLPVDAEFPVEGRSHHSQLHNVPSVQAIVKKAIVQRLSEVYHRRTRLPETGALYSLEVAINKDQVMLTLDTTGDSLFKRGYRRNKGGAPLKENMAAALVLLAHWFTDNPFVDPVCGSGTIPIEAALIGHNIAPGINRSFVCEQWTNLTPAGLSDEVRDEADAQADYDVELDIHGYDIDQNMIDIAQENCRAAGLTHDIAFKQLAVKDWHTDKINGVIVANPPYGERLSDHEAVHELYRQMGDIYRPMTTWSKYILTADLEFEKYYGAPATKRRKLYNGALRTDLFQYWGKKKR